MKNNVTPSSTSQNTRHLKRRSSRRPFRELSEVLRDDGSSYDIRLLRMQGWRGAELDQAAAAGGALRLAPGFCAAGAVAVVLSGSSILALALMLTAVVGTGAKNHPIETIYNWVAPMAAREPLPRNKAAKRLGCLIGGALLAASALSLAFGSPLVGRAFAGALAVVAGFVSITNFCVPSAIFVTLFGSERSTACSLFSAGSTSCSLPSNGTPYLLPAQPTPEQIADWCHPRRSVGMPELSDLSAPQVTIDATVSTPPKRLLGVWAHPDDEAYLSSGLMAQTIDAGGHVTILTLTDGEVGFPDEDPRSSFERGQQRRSELRSALGSIGVTDVRFLGIADGGVATADHDGVVERISALIDEVQPDVIVTFGPDGITGHSDHVVNCELVTRAWLDQAQGELWYAAKTTDWLATWRDLHDEFGVWMTEEPTGVDSDDIEIVVDLDGAALDRKRAVLAAHRSQTAGLSAAFGEDRYREWISQEAFRRPSASELDTRRRSMSMIGSAAS